jgi:hypothetical protein
MNPLTIEQQYRTESLCQGNLRTSVSLEDLAECSRVDSSGQVGKERKQTDLRLTMSRCSGWSLREKIGAKKEWGGGLSQKEEEIASWSAGATTARTSTLVHSHRASTEPMTHRSLREHRASSQIRCHS